MPRVIAIGGLTLDWLQTSSRVHGPSLGGNAAYAAAGARLAGGDGEIVAMIGDDYPMELLTQLADVGIGTADVRVVPGPSFRVLLDERGPRRIISYLPGSGRNDRLDPIPAYLPAEIKGAGVHVCAIPTWSQRSLIDAVGAQARATTLDSIVIPGQIEPVADELIALGRETAAFLPSIDEVTKLWPGPVEVTLESLREAGIERVVIKMGVNGSIGIDARGICRMPAYATNVVDTTGAGDAYCGAFCAQLTEGAELSTAMAWGAAAASIVVEGYGVAPALDPDGPQRVAERAEALLAQSMQYQ